MKPGHLLHYKRENGNEMKSDPPNDISKDLMAGDRPGGALPRNGLISGSMDRSMRGLMEIQL